MALQYVVLCVCVTLGIAYYDIIDFQTCLAQYSSKFICNNIIITEAQPPQGFDLPAVSRRGRDTASDRLSGCSLACPASYTGSERNGLCVCNKQ